MLTVERLREVLHYDPETGDWRWRLSNGRRAIAGEAAGYLNDEGRRCIGIDWHTYKASRLAWLYMTGEWPSGEIDHKNRKPADDRWANLRDATRAQNQINNGLRANNTTGATGVYQRGDRWQAYIGARPKIYLGVFGTREEAQEAYRKAAIERYGEFSR
jgi:hypothetical protein